MKKIAVFALCALLTVAMAGCGENKTSDTSSVDNTSISNVSGTAQVINPISDFQSLDEINAEAGTNLVSPGVMGSQDVSFSVINTTNIKIAEYSFKVNSTIYTFRAAKGTDEDISGIYIAGENAFGSVRPNGIEFNSDDENKVARWFVDDVQYTVSINDFKQMKLETFKANANELKSRTEE